MEYREISVEDKKIESYAAFLQLCFPRVNKYNFNYLAWLYRNNPEGPAIGYDAYENNRIVAHYACIPTSIKLHGRNAKGLLSLNTATHPEFQGRGLFTKLAEMTYLSGEEKGFSCVYGVANSNSTPGFIRKLNFQFVQPLEARVGFGKLCIETPPNITQLKREWTQNSLNWRCSNPTNPVFWKENKGKTFFFAKTFSKFILSYSELDINFLPTMIKAHRALHLSPIRLFIGLIPGETVKFKKYFSIPTRFKPSPLNFIYRPFSIENQMLDRGSVNFSFMDFDAY